MLLPASETFPCSSVPELLCDEFVTDPFAEVFSEVFVSLFSKIVTGIEVVLGRPSALQLTDVFKQLLGVPTPD